MKKSSKSIKTDVLLINVVEFAFIEWLVRRGVFSAFKANYERDLLHYKSFRERLHAHVRRSLSGVGFGPSYLISSAFLFASTPEGVEFWSNQSAAWERFCDELQAKL